MRYLKDIAVSLVIAMIVSVLPMTAIAVDNQGSVSQAEAESPSAPTSDPNPDASAEPSPDASADPESTEAPTEAPTDKPEQTPDSSAAPEPEASATPTSKPNGKYSVTVAEMANANIAVTPKSASAGTRVSVNGTTDRGYRFSKVYYEYTENDAKNEKTISSKSSHSVDAAFVMPSSDVTVYSEVKELSAGEVAEDADDQIDEVTELNSSYTSAYINNSSDYSSSDISSMRKYINSAKSLIADLRKANEELKDAISTSDLTKTLKDDVIDIQTELDEVTDDMKDLAAEMGGEAVDSFDMSITVTKGGRVNVSGLVSETVNASSVKKNVEIEDIHPDGSSLSFTITATSGYSLSTFKINGKSISVTGNKVTIKASAIGNYVKNGYMDVVANFTYSGYSNGGSNGGYGGGITAGGNNGSNNIINNGSSADPTPTAAPVIGGYTDIADVDWAADAIVTLSSLGIVNGMGDGLFSPRATVTREQFAKMIVGVMGYAVDNAAVTDFTDANGAWYTPYIAAAVSNGIVTGRDNGTFGVGDNITRQDMAVIIYRALGSNASEVHQFTDSDMISDYAIEAVSALYNMGVISGYTDGTFAPGSNASRAEAAKMLHSVYEIIHSGN